MIGAARGRRVLAVTVASPVGAQDSKQAESVLKIGWAQDPQTLNPFVGQDEEDFTRLGDQLGPARQLQPQGPHAGPGHREELGHLARQEDGHLPPRPRGAKWSDGKPITSADVKYSLEMLGSNGALFTSYTDNVTSIETPDAQTVVIKTKRPDARIVGGLFIYILPKHIWGKVPVSDLTGSYKPKLPLVGSGPYIVTDFEHGRILTMERNPNFRGTEPKFDKIEFVKYGNQDAVERALQLGEVDLVPEVSSANFDRLGTTSDIATLKADLPPTPSWRSTVARRSSAPTRSSTPPSRTAPFARPSPMRSTASGSTRSPPGTRRSRATASCRRSTRRSTSSRRRTTRSIPTRRSRSSTTPAGAITVTAPGQRATRSSRSTSTFARSRRPTSRRPSSSPRRPRPIGVQFNVQVVSTDKLTELTMRKVNGKPAPDFDTFIWGWGGDPVRPELPAQHPDHRRDRRLVGLVLLEPRLRPALQGAGRRVRQREAQGRSSSGWSRSPSATCPTWC